MASGVKVSDEVKQCFQAISMSTKKHEKKKFGIFKFSDDAKNIVVESSGGEGDVPGSSYDGLIESLPDDDVRYIAFDFDFCNKDGTKKSEIIFVSWHPQKCSVRRKMICASSFNALKAALSVSKNILEGDAFNEVDSKAALEKVGGTAVPT